jgi:hypothetical protein
MKFLARPVNLVSSARSNPAQGPLDPIEVQGREELVRGLEMVKGRPTSLLVFPDPLTFSNRTVIVEWAARSRVPALFGALKGAKPADNRTHDPAIASAARWSRNRIDRIARGRPNAAPYDDALARGFASRRDVINDVLEAGGAE